MDAKHRVAVINTVPVDVGPKETILDAALRAGIPFPSSCRVGGCGTCKCRLVAGRVEERTESAYLLTAEELENGIVLACQSVPRTPEIRVEVVLPADGPARTRTGRVVGHETLTADIARLRIALDAPLDYRAGQFVSVGFLREPDLRRSYSFASLPRDDARQIELIVRRVPGGRLSNQLANASVVGREIVVEGPHGDGRLGSGASPLLLVAGGSGLAPILALARQAIHEGIVRDARLVFGARRREDLYLLDEIGELVRTWPGNLAFVPVLSDEPAGSSWQGARGLVTDVLQDALVDGAEAHVCGPPAMVDATFELLVRRGLPSTNIHLDRFATPSDAAARSPRSADDRAPAGLLDYAKFFAFHATGAVALLALLAGGRAIVLGLVGIVLLYTVGDELGGDDTTTPRYASPRILTVQLWLALPLIALIVGAAVWSGGAGDALGLGAALSRLTGRDLLAWREATTPAEHAAGILLTGLLIGMVGTIPAHELTHRTSDPVSMFVGRWLLAFSFDTAFAVEHVHGHHRYVSTAHDPATAPRGRSVYAHVVLSTLRGNASAWRIEAERLSRRGRRTFSLRNAVLRGYGMSLSLVVAALLVGGVSGALFFVASGALGKALLEVVNYMEHYGLTRDPGTPVAPRHSWNSNRRLSSWALFNLSRHSHHHAQGEVPYHELEPYPDAPLMPGGYLSTIVLALVPPLWFRIMAPRLQHWDHTFATETERALARGAAAGGGVSCATTPGQAGSRGIAALAALLRTRRRRASR